MGKPVLFKIKCTECEPSQFASSRERIAADNEEICNATQQRMLSGQPVQTHLWQFKLPDLPRH